MAATNHAQSIKRDSQTYLTTALLQLLATHDLNTITVTQVVKRAGVSRMAFYRNFNSLEELLTAYFEPAIHARFQEVLEHVDADQKLTAIGGFFADFAPTMQLAEQRGFEFVIRQIFNENMADFYRATMSDTGLAPVQLKYWTKFMSAGVYTIWREWLLTGQTESLTTIHDLIATFQNATTQALIQRR
ncbi:TetR/AcrR family transcriptional regulator [Lactiplantibacillus herbarum]|uniref:TetR/AcrR family transcriptional regulator n=1 Tax=Lactiplantibacillus herbarum TaxID=1670446 RepID=UPI00064E7EC1|nr:TetR/AcrR family transcriptional regulator [Lactiplantibacillus herbarum]